MGGWTRWDAGGLLTYIAAYLLALDWWSIADRVVLEYCRSGRPVSTAEFCGSSLGGVAMACRAILRLASVGVPFLLASVASLDPVVSFAWGNFKCHGAEVEPANTEGLDARHVKTEAPSKVVTDQVFKASVTMKNTGGRPWGDGIKLRSNDPVDNMNWGTTFIYLGQGRGCKPGEQITFSSWLKAPTKNTLDMVELLTYPWPKDVCAPRNGDYSVANCSWGGRAPESPGKGSWTMDDRVRAGVFIDLPEKHGFLALAYLGTGRIGYDYGAIRSAGHVNYWYFYNPSDLAAACGARQPWELAPHSAARVEYPKGVRQDSRWGSVVGEPTGCCFDEEARLLYVYQRFCIDNRTRELFPCIHAYRIK